VWAGKRSAAKVLLPDPGSPTRTTSSTRSMVRET
jgi:hypothetical protein